MPNIKLDIIADLTPIQVGLDETVSDLKVKAGQLGNEMANAFTKADAKARVLDNDLKKEVTDLKEIEKQLNKNNTAINKSADAAKGANKEFSGLNNTLQNIATNLTATLSVGALVSFTKKIIETRAEFQRFEAVLTNTLGSKSLAQNALLQIQQFAAQTPFSVSELTASFVKLANQGFEPTIVQLRQLGDLAASQGKSFDQLTEAIIDAQTGEFERLKEFGIRASKQGDQVTFAFKGVQTQTEFTNDAIRKYILSLGDLEGVSGGMAAISETLGGQISNLGDNFDALFNNLGKQGQGVFNSIFEAINNNLTETNKGIGLINQFQESLRGTSGEFGNLETTFSKSTGFFIEFQKQLNGLTSQAAEFKTEMDFVPLFGKLNTVLQIVNAQYARGAIDIATYNRQVLLIGTAVQTLIDQQKHLVEQQAKAAEIAKQKTPQQIAAEEAAYKKRKKLLEDFAKAQEDLNKRVAKAQLDNLTGKEKIQAQLKFDQDEIDLLQKHFIETGKLVDANFKLTIEQEKQFGVLRNEARQKALDALIKIEVDKQNELAKAKVTSAQGANTNLGLEQANAVNSVLLAPNTIGADPEEFERQKQIAALRIQQEFAVKKLQAQQEVAIAEKNQSVAELNGQLELLKRSNDAQTALKRQQINESIALIEERFALETTKLEDETALQINDLQAKQEELFAQAEAKRLDRIKAFVGAATQISSALEQLAEQALQTQLNQVNQEIDITNKKQDEYQKQIDALKSKLEQEQALNRQGLTNNSDAVQAQLLQVEAAKKRETEIEQQAIIRKKRLQQEQLAIDTILQSSNLFTTITEIYAGLAKIDPTGISGTIASAALLAAFALQKAEALKVINNGNNFAGGVIGLEGPGTETSDSIPTNLSKGESVMRAKTTRQHKELLTALHEENPIMYRQALLKELVGSGVILQKELPERLRSTNELVKRTELKTTFTQDNSKSENELREIKNHIAEMRKAQNNTIYIDGNGNTVIKKGVNTIIIRKNG